MSSIKVLMRSSVLALLATLLFGCDSGDSGGSGGAGESAVDTSPAAQERPAAAESAPAETDGPDVPVVAERLPYAEVDDQLVYGHFVFPADMVDPLPAVILIHESWGLNDHIRARADRLAAEGYIVLAVDLFGGDVAANAAEARLQMVSVVENPESARENLRQAHAFVSDTAAAPRVGSVGWDFGGGWSLNAALLFPDELDAAVIVYGQVTDDQDTLGRIDAPLLGLFAGKDRSVTIDSVRRFETALESLGKNVEIHVYPEANHSFADPASEAYDSGTAEDAWQRTINFLNLYLRINDSDSA